MVRVLVNGKPVELEPGATVQTVVTAWPDAPQGRGVAVALEGEVVPRGEWTSTRLAAGARLEIVVAVQGG
jgi:sulfur carrier protein